MTFEIKNLPEDIIKEMKGYNIWNEDCPVALDDLILVEILHYNFDDKIIPGEIIVHRKLAKDTLSIFQQLLELEFPINSVKLINEFKGDDILSMSMNNSSGFNFRAIENSTLISMHSYGMAIDINPVQNPYIINSLGKNPIILPKAGENFMDRSKIRKGMIEEVVEIFTKTQFAHWGGDWSEPIDYHHFQVPRNNISSMV